MPRIININGRQWLAGMSWCSFEDVPSREELQDDASRLHSEWCAVRIGEAAIQAGFCEPIDDIKRPAKLYSLAAMLADSREQPWLGIFKIEEGLWWYIAVRDHHAILPDGDIIGGEKEIHAARDRHSGYTDWKYIEGDIRLLAEFMEDIGEKPTPVKSLVSTNIPTVPIAVAAAIVLATAAGGYWWWHQKKVEEERERAIAMAKMRAQIANQKTPVVAPPSPLLTIPDPNSMVRACGRIILSQPLSMYGWTLGPIECNQTSVSLTWLREDGATVIKKPEGELSTDGEKVIQSIPLGLEQKGNNNAIELPREELAIRGWAQAAGIALSLNRANPPMALPGADNTNVPPPIPQSNIRFDLAFAPFWLDFSTIPGLRLTRVKSTAAGWSIEGALYGTR